MVKQIFILQHTPVLNYIQNIILFSFKFNSIYGFFGIGRGKN